MPRRSARREKPAEERDETPDEQTADPGQDEEAQQEQDDAQDAPEDQMAEDGALPKLKFNEELTWRPTKPIATATLIARLEKLSKELEDFDQGGVDVESLQDVADKLAQKIYFQHKDKGVKAYAACCLVDILRLFVPSAPFTSEQLKGMFTLFVRDILSALYDPTNPYNSQHKYVLMSLSDVKSILLINEIDGSDELLLKLFNSTFDGVSACEKANAEEQLSKDVEIHLGDMLMQLIDEAPGSVSTKVIDAIISQFLRASPPGGKRKENQEQNGQSTLLVKTEPAAYVMAKNICNGCADKMARYVSQYFSDVILNASRFATKGRGKQKDDESDEEDGSSGPSAEDLKSLQQAHQLIRELWRAAPTILQNVVPQLDAELSADNVHLRLIATETFGDMISGIGVAGPPPAPVIDPAAYPVPRMSDEPTEPSPQSNNVLVKPFSPQSFAQSHSAAYRNFLTRRIDKDGTIRAAWTTAAGHILSTSAGGIGLSREDEQALVNGLRDKLSDSEEKVRLAAIKAIELFDFKDIVQKLGIEGGVFKEGTILACLGDRCKDRKPAVRVEAMVLLGRLWAAATGDLVDGQESVTACLSGIPSKIIHAYYANDPDLNILLDRVMFECLIPLKYPLVKGKNKSSVTPADQDRLRAERILLLLKHLDARAQTAFFAMQARQLQFAPAVNYLVQRCEAYNGGQVSGPDAPTVKAALNRACEWLGGTFPDPLKVRADVMKLAKMNDRRSYQLIKYAIGSESDFKTVRRAINELIGKVQNHRDAASCLDTLIPLLYRSSCLVFNRSHLSTIMDYSKNDTGGFASTAHLILNEISQRNPDLFSAHAEELCKDITEQTPSETKPNDPSVVDILKAYSSYAKKYPAGIKQDRAFSQSLTNYALYGTPPKAAKYAVNILMAKRDDKGKVTATNLLQKVMKRWEYGSPHFLNKLTTVSQLERLAPAVTIDSADAINDMCIKQILREVKTDAKSSDPEWVEDEDMNEELQAKCLALRVLVNQTLANEEEEDAEERVKPVIKLLRTFVVSKGEFCKHKDTPEHHKKRLRLLAGLLLLKLCTIKKYDDQVEPETFNKLVELVQAHEPQVRRRFMEKLQNYLTRGRLKARFYTLLFLAAFEPVTDLKNRIETWIRSRARLYEARKSPVLEAIIGRLIPLLAHHPDFDNSVDDLADIAKYFFFYLDAVATEDNISLIYRYAERVKQTRDGLKPESSDNLYVLSDLAQAMIRKYQERRNWSFQAWPGKVGLPTGLYTALPSSEVAQQIAKKQYIPEALDERLDDLLRQKDRKKKRKSTHDWSENPSSKKPKTQLNTVIRSKQESKPKAPSSQKVKKSKKPSSSSSKKPKKKATATSPEVPDGERRRSGRARATSNYADRRDSDDEAEMLDGVAEWTYRKNGGRDDDDGTDNSDDNTGDDGEESDAEDEEASGDGDDAGEEDGDEKEEEENSAPKKPVRTSAVKAAVLTKLGKGRNSRSRGTKASDMELD